MPAREPVASVIASEVKLSHGTRLLHRIVRDKSVKELLFHLKKCGFQNKNGSFFKSNISEPNRTSPVE